MKRQGLILIIFLLPLIALWGCEGDEGPAGLVGVDGTDGTDGTDGVDGIDGNVTCLECHNTDRQNSISLQYDRSQHGLGDIAVDYAGGRGSCAECHSGNGYVEYVQTGGVDANFTTPEPFACSTCHATHTTFESTDEALRMPGAINWLFDATDVAVGSEYDFEDNSNVCAFCHQSRRGEPLLTNPDDETFDITSTHYGPHHGAQSNVLAGMGFAEIAGPYAYGGNFPHASADVTCVTCHMGTYSEGEGGHTFLPNLANCTDCHDSAIDFNIGNVQTSTAALLEELRVLLLDQGVIEWVVEDEAYEPVVGTHTMVQARAFFNWIGLEEDRSMGVHNPGYVEALLQNSIAAITPAPAF